MPSPTEPSQQPCRFFLGEKNHLLLGASVRKGMAGACCGDHGGRGLFVLGAVTLRGAIRLLGMASKSRVSASQAGCPEEATNKFGDGVVCLSNSVPRVTLGLPKGGRLPLLDNSASPLLRPHFHLPEQTQGTISKLLGLLIPPSLGSEDRAVCTRENAICLSSEAGVLSGRAQSALCLGVPSAEACSPDLPTFPMEPVF